VRTNKRNSKQQQIITNGTPLLTDPTTHCNGKGCCTLYAGSPMPPPQYRQHNINRSTGTVHTSAKVCLPSVAIRIQICDPDHHQNLIWTIANLPRKFHANLFGSFCAKLLTNKQTTMITNPPWQR